MELIQIFKELVSIDSPSKEEKKVSDYIMNWSEKNGFSCKQDEFGNLIIRTNNQTSAKVFFSAHMDTVEPGRGIVCMEKDGYLVSSGNTILGADNKASLAGIIHAVSSLDKSDIPSIELVFTTEEESAMNAKSLSKNIITAPYGYVFDAPFEFGGIILSSPFIEDFNCKIIGKAAHASIPGSALSVLPILKNMLDRIECGYINQDSDSGTVNVGIVSAGSGVNTVPGSTEIKGEIRSLKKEIFESKKKEIEKIFSELKEENPNYVFEYSFKNFAPGYVHSKTEKFIENAQKSIESIGRNFSFMSPQSVSDANHFNFMGIPALVISEGTQNAHTVEERISVEDLHDISKLVVELIKNA